jgi:hypothetical protein
MLSVHSQLVSWKITEMGPGRHQALFEIASLPAWVPVSHAALSAILLIFRAFPPTRLIAPVRARHMSMRPGNRY